MIRHFLSTLLIALASTVTLVATDKTPPLDVIPMEHPWDANAWESGSSTSFWRVKGASSAKNAPVTQSTIRGTEGTPATAPKEDFSSRQSEK